MQKIINAVRILSFKDDKILCIKYKKDEHKDYYDIPGGIIENNETELETCTRELKEETGMNAKSFSFMGTINIIYPTRKYILKTYLAHNAEGEPKTFEKNYSCYLKIKDLVTKPKIFPIIHILNDKYTNLLKNKKFNIIIECSEEHKITSICYRKA